MTSDIDKDAATDLAHMRAALALAGRGLGQVWPNPSVGCVLVRDGAVVGRGHTAATGRPHAETQALDQAGGRADGATAYVTLEPCSHSGMTPPCADALIAAGIRRAVVATLDPDPRVSGRGLDRLRDAGIRTDLGLCGAEARFQNAGFLSRVERGRPLITLKFATSLDGRIATHRGESQWITGPASRAHGHLLRAESDAILIGSGTALADNPRLDCRLPGLEHRSPLRIVVDGHLRLPLTGHLVSGTSTHPLWLLTRSDNPSERLSVLANLGVDVIEIPIGSDDRIDLALAMTRLGDRGVTRLLVEAGGRLAAALMRADLVDRLVWFRAPILLGGDGIPALAPFGIDHLADAPHWRPLVRARLGSDVMEILQKDP